MLLAFEITWVAVAFLVAMFEILIRHGWISRHDRPVVVIVVVAAGMTILVNGF